jgi:translocator protein
LQKAVSCVDTYGFRKAVPVSRSRQIAGLAVSLLIVFLAASVGSYFTNLSVKTWYPTLVKPSWTPSGVTIGIVWTVLYALMAIAAWIVWQYGGRLLQRSFVLYAIQLILNVGWSALFFGIRSPGLALLGIILLWIAILATLLEFQKVSQLAGFLMLPYLIWVTFAGFLNALVWRLN